MILLSENCKKVSDSDHGLTFRASKMDGIDKKVTLQMFTKNRAIEKRCKASVSLPSTV